MEKRNFERMGPVLLLYQLPVGSSFEKLAENWKGGYKFASFGSDEIPKMEGGRYHSCYLHS